MPEAGRNLFDLRLLGHQRRAGRLDRDHDRLLEDRPQDRARGSQRPRDPIDLRRKMNASPDRSGRSGALHELQVGRDIKRHLLDRGERFVPAPCPGLNEQQQKRCDQQREPGAVQDFDKVGAKKGNVDDCNRHENRNEPPDRPLPLVSCHDHSEERRAQQRSGDGQAVGIGEACRGFKVEHRAGNSNKHHQRDNRHRNLAPDGL